MRTYQASPKKRYVARVGFEPTGLEIMSLTSYQTALPHDVSPNVRKKMRLGFLLLCHAAAVLLWYFWFIPREVRVNAADIKADGSADTLKFGYHQRRWFVRLLAALSFVAAATLLAWLVHVPHRALLPSAALLLVLLFGLFTRYFDPQLAVARGLHPFYTSTESASFPDRPIWARVRTANPGQPDSALQETAETVHHTWLNRILAGTLLLYAAGWVLLLFL